MKKRRAMTAKELMAELENDPDYQAGLRAQEQRLAAIRESERTVIREIQEAGVHVDSLADLRQRYLPLPDEVVQVLLRCLESVVPQVQDEIVRTLASVEKPFDVRPLTRLFEMTESDSLRWAIANTLTELRPLDLREWLVEALARREYGRSREMLPLAVARTAPPSVANKVLLSHFDEMPGHVALGLAESGGSYELEVLRERAPSTKGWVRKEIDRAIRIDRKSVV